MIIGVGIDVVELDRISRIWSRFYMHFARKILTPEELRILPKDPVAYLGSRFAAKEAAVKALGTGFTGGISFQHLCVHPASGSPPRLELKGKAKEKAGQLEVQSVNLSLSHTREMACAIVILE